jgi:hypothetical protein
LIYRDAVKFLIQNFISTVREGKMAKPVVATPSLSGREATDFLIKVHKNASKPVGLTPTPKLAMALESLKRDAEQHQKHS